MKKALFLHSEMSGYFLACMQALAEKNVEVHLVTWPVNPEAPFSFDYPNTFRIYNRSRFNTETLQETAFGIEPDVICCTGWMDKVYMDVMLAFGKKHPAILMMDNWWLGTFRQRMAAFASPFMLKTRFTHVWVPGKHQELFARKLGFSEDKIMKDLYSCDYNFFSNQFELNRNAKAASFPKRFLFTGRFMEIKGLQDLWDAFKAVDCDWELWCAGTGPLEASFPPHPRIRNVGFVQPAEMVDIISNTGVFILPSRVEPWGVAVHEFAAAGMPLICSDAVGAAYRFLSDGENGFMFPARNVSALEDSIQRIVSMDGSGLAAMGERSNTIAGAITPGKWASKLLEATGN